MLERKTRGGDKEKGSQHDMMTKEQEAKFRYHKMVVHLSDRHNHHPGHKSRRQEYNGHWHMGTD